MARQPKQPRQRVHKPTEETRNTVRMHAAVGTRYVDIAAKLGITDDTLRKYYRAELDDGRIDANAKVAQSLFQQAISGNTVAMIFWLKTRGQWREAKDDTAGMTPEQIGTVAQAAIAAATAISGRP